MSKTVCIIGAGAAGLPAIRWCLNYDFKPVCYEMSDDLGGLWRYKNFDCTGEATVMKSTIINTSKEMTAYSDCIPPPKFANFMHNTKMLEYLRQYAKMYDLEQHITYKTKVLNAQRASDYDTTGRWTIEIEDLQTKKTRTETYDGVLVCTGHHVEPHVPTFEGQEKFEGQIIHSHAYHDHKGYEDKRVVVVGVGNSGGDVAVELSRMAKQVYLSTRRGMWVTNRVFDKGDPVDTVIVTRFLTQCRILMPIIITNWIIESYLNKRFDHTKYGIRPNNHITAAHPTINDELPNRIISGTVIIKANIRRFIGGKSIMFEDGTTLDDIDNVILGTGFSFGFPVLEQNTLIPIKENQVSLYKNMYKPDLKHPETMAIIGMVQPIGSIVPIAEIQCYVFCEMLSGGHKLPSEMTMKEDIRQYQEKMAKQYVTSRRHTIQVDFAGFMDELAELIDAKPDLKELAFSDPMLAFQVLFGPQSGYQYRLHGPKPWKGARDAIMGQRERILTPFATRYVEPRWELNDYYNLFQVIFVVVSAFVLFKLFL